MENTNIEGSLPCIVDMKFNASVQDRSTLC
jgi:hypothetical protein